MILVYSFVLGFLSMVCFIPIYLKIVSNSFFILIAQKLEKSKGQNLKDFVGSIVLGPVLIAVSLIVDFVRAPLLLLREEDGFELKYQHQGPQMNKT